MRVHEMYEIKLNGPKLAAHWAAADVTAEFTDGQESRTVKGFYSGEGEYCVRFLPDRAANWHWKVSGAVNGEGSFVCEEAASGSHGMVQAYRTHFRYQDGEWFYPFGTTIYALMHQEEALIDETMETLRTSPFNKVRFCVFPKHYNYNHNEPQFYPFEKNEDGSWDVSRPCLAFWDHFERRLMQLLSMGIQADTILFHPYDRWGFSRMTQEENLLYLDYVIRRLGAYPNVWWSLANEYDLMPQQMGLDEWYEIEEFVAKNDSYHHLLSNHNCFKEWDFARTNITHVSIQTKRLFQIPEWLAMYQKPVMIDECCYEGNIEEMWGNLSGREMTNRFWRAVASGAYCTHGETFLDRETEVLWWAKGGRLKGESPSRIRFLRDIVSELPGPIEPLQEGLQQMLIRSDEELAAALEQTKEEMRVFLASALRMGREGRRLHDAVEHEWKGHCGEQAYLYFMDQQCMAEKTVELPEGRTYRAQVIDTWEMTRETVAEGLSGKCVIPMPGKPGMALLIKEE